MMRKLSVEWSWTSKGMDAWIRSAFGHGLFQFVSLHSIRSFCPNSHKQIYNYIVLHVLCRLLGNIYKSEIWSASVRRCSYSSPWVQEQNSTECANINYRTAWMEWKWASGRSKDIEMQLCLLAGNMQTEIIPNLLKHFILDRKSVV